MTLWLWQYVIILNSTGPSHRAVALSRCESAPNERMLPVLLTLDVEHRGASSMAPADASWPERPGRYTTCTCTGSAAGDVDSGGLLSFCPLLSVDLMDTPINNKSTNIRKNLLVKFYYLKEITVIYIRHRKRKWRQRKMFWENIFCPKKIFIFIPKYFLWKKINIFFGRKYFSSFFSIFF